MDEVFVVHCGGCSFLCDLSEQQQFREEEERRWQAGVHLRYLHTSRGEERLASMQVQMFELLCTIMIEHKNLVTYDKH